MADQEGAAAPVLIESMAWPDIEAAIKGGSTTAIIVAASSEQHGPHLPEATDALIGQAVASRLAARLGNALVAPVIRPGCSDHHMAFAGSITISAELLMMLLDANVDSLARHGFERFIVFSSHGGNFPVLTTWAARQERDSVTVITDLPEYANVMLSALRPFGRNDTTIPHADATETSVILATNPDLVHMERAARGYEGDAGLEEVLSRGLRAITPNGIMGNALGSTPEMGEAVLEALVEYLVEKATP